MIKQEKGIVIIAVLWICALIMWFSLQISTDSRLRGEEEVQILRRSQSLYLAIGGAYEALAHMGHTVDADEEAEEGNWMPNGAPNTVKYETGQAIVVIEDESKKVNINIPNHDLLVEVLEKAGLAKEESDALANVITDFLDSDDLPGLQGAEKDDYKEMGIPYAPFNGLLTGLDQLLLIPGVTQKLFYGYDQKAKPFKKSQYKELRDLPWPGEDSLFQNCSIYGSNVQLSETEDLTDDEDLEDDEDTEEKVAWAPNGIYRILSSGKASTGSPSVLLWMVVQYRPDQKPGYEVLYRKIL